MTRGPYIVTYTGIKFHPLDPQPEEIRINDIAHALANQCRFAGHTREMYSIAQHSVLVSRYCSERHALWGLLHDASEAYLCDIPRPLKHSSAMEGYRLAEFWLMDAVCKRFGLSAQAPREVHEVDNRMLMTERRDLMAKPPDDPDWPSVEPYPEEVRVWRPAFAEQVFLARFGELVADHAARDVEVSG